MARIARSDHTTIRQMVDVEGRKVAEVAAEFECSPANIYTLLTKLRRQGPPPAMPEPEPEPAAATEPVAIPKDLFAAGAAAQPAAKPAPPPRKAVTPPLAVANPPPPVAIQPTANPAPARPPAPPRGGIGAKAAKPGFGLCMRMSDGEDTLTPFRSLEDLLSAVKPMLRAAARSQDTIWFSIQQVDLTTIETDDL